MRNAENTQAMTRAQDHVREAENICRLEFERAKGSDAKEPELKALQAAGKSLENALEALIDYAPAS